MPIPLLAKNVRILRKKIFRLKGGVIYEVAPEDEAICISEPKTFAEANLRNLDDKDGMSKFWYRVFVKKTQGPKSPGFAVDIADEDLGIYNPEDGQVIPINTSS